MMPEDLRLFRVLSDGTLRTESPYLVTCQCALSIETFPFDEQTCPIILGSWMYPTSEVNLVSTYIEQNDSEALYTVSTYTKFWFLLCIKINFLTVLEREGTLGSYKY
jgi:hypothetical protein